MSNPAITKEEAQAAQEEQKRLAINLMLKQFNEAQENDEKKTALLISYFQDGYNTGMKAGAGQIIQVMEKVVEEMKNKMIATAEGGING